MSSGAGGLEQANQLREVRTAQVQKRCALVRALGTVGGDLVLPIDQLGVRTVTSDQSRHLLLAFAGALGAVHTQHSALDLDEITEHDGAGAGHRAT